jgi:MOSC domain-containing protein YiiM
MSSRFKFPRRVRIHGGECGAVARALHHGEQGRALMTYECESLALAGAKKVLASTISERK